MLQHYSTENFPVASWWLPVKLKRPLQLIYRFARTGDDLVDEGHDTLSDRVQKLDLLEQELLLGHRSTVPWIQALQGVMDVYSIPLDPFLALLSGFRADLFMNRYQNFNELLNYCQKVAHPIGHLWLYLVGQDTPAHRKLSDHLSTALQLTDIIQDVALDYQRHNRIYMPQEDWRGCGFKENDLMASKTATSLQQLLHIMSQKAECHLNSSLALSHTIRGLAGLQLRLCQKSCAALLVRCHQRTSHWEVPRLKKRDWVVLLLHSFW